MEVELMDVSIFSWSFFSLFLTLFAIAVPVLVLVVLVVWILNHRDKTGAGTEGNRQGRRLYKSRTDKMLAGVCGGIAEYFNIDSTLVRIGLVFFTFCGGSGLLLYIIAAIVMPVKPMTEPQ